MQENNSGIIINNYKLHNTVDHKRNNRNAINNATYNVEYTKTVSHLSPVYFVTVFVSLSPIRQSKVYKTDEFVTSLLPALFNILIKFFFSYH